MHWQFSKPTKDERPKTEKKRSSEVHCPLCGKTFSAGEAMPCASCGLAKKCGLVMCPNCHYEFAA